jgi:hypothetical protein
VSRDIEMPEININNKVSLTKSTWTDYYINYSCSLGIGVFLILVSGQYSDQSESWTASTILTRTSTGEVARGAISIGSMPTTSYPSISITNMYNQGQGLTGYMVTADGVHLKIAGTKTDIAAVKTLKVCKLFNIDISEY